MSTQHASQDTSANPSKDSPTCPERDGRKTAQDDSTEAQDNKPPNHGIPTHGKSRFLWEVDKDTPISELGDRYQQWLDQTEQSELSRWSE
jgi:hypothetical protein